MVVIHGPLSFLPLSATMTIKASIVNRHTPSDQSRVYRVTHLRTDRLRCRESAGDRASSPQGNSCNSVLTLPIQGNTVDQSMYAPLSPHELLVSLGISCVEVHANRRSKTLGLLLTPQKSPSQDLVLVCCLTSPN